MALEAAYPSALITWVYAGTRSAWGLGYVYFREQLPHENSNMEQAGSLQTWGTTAKEGLPS